MVGFGRFTSARSEDAMISEHLFLEWVEIQKRSLKLMNRKDFSGALQELDSFLQRGQPAELESEIFGFRGIVLEDQGKIEEAKREYLNAHRLSAEATYNRYGIELTLGRLSEAMNDSREAATWYFRAAQTASEDRLTSGAAAVAGFLDVRDRATWEDHEIRLVERVVRQAWELFSLPGEPDLVNLRETLQILAEASTRPLPMTGGPQSV